MTYEEIMAGAEVLNAYYKTITTRPFKITA